MTTNQISTNDSQHSVLWGHLGSVGAGGAVEWNGHLYCVRYEPGIVILVPWSALAAADHGNWIPKEKHTAIKVHLIPRKTGMQQLALRLMRDFSGPEFLPPPGPCRTSIEVANSPEAARAIVCQPRYNLEAGFVVTAGSERPAPASGPLVENEAQYLLLERAEPGIENGNGRRYEWETWRCHPVNDPGAVQVMRIGQHWHVEDRR